MIECNHTPKVKDNYCRSCLIRNEKNRWLDNSNLLTDNSKGIPAFIKELLSEYVPQSIPKFHKLLYCKLLSLLNPLYKNKYDRLFELISFRGSAKCLSGDTKVIMEDGTFKYIKDIEIGDKVKSLNKQLKFENDIVLNKIESGDKNLIAIKTRSGNLLRCSKDHKIFTFNGWKKAKDLTLNDYIASPRQIPIESNIEIPDEELKFLVYLIAEGSLSHGNCKFTNADKEVVNDFFNCCNKLGFNVKQSGKPIDYSITTKENEPRKLLRKYGLFGHTSHTKRLPKLFFKLSNRQKWIIISCLMVTDGWFTLSKGKGGITLCNKELIEDIKIIFQHLGIVTYSWYKKAGYKKYDKNFHSYVLEFGDQYLQKVIDNCNLLQKTNKANKCLGKDRYSLLDIYPKDLVKYIPEKFGEYIYENNIHPTKYRGYYQFTRNKVQDLIKDIRKYQKDELFTEIHLEVLENADVFWDKIYEIKEDKKEITYDITIEKNANFIANGLVVHNSTVANFLFPMYLLLNNEETIQFPIYSNLLEWFEKDDVEPILEKIVEAKIEERFIVIASETGGMAEAFVSRMRDEIDTNDYIKYYYYGEIKEALDDSTGNWTKSAFKFNNCYVFGRGAGQQMRGIIKGANRPSYLIFDDIYSDANVITPESRAKVRKWFNDTAIKSVDDLKGKIALLGTIVHDDTVLIDCEKNTRWETIKAYPMPPENFEKFLKDHIVINHFNNVCKLPGDDLETKDERVIFQQEYFNNLLEKNPYGLYWKDRVGYYQLAISYQEAFQNGTLNSFYQEYFHITISDSNKKFKKEHFQFRQVDFEFKYGYTWIKRSPEDEWEHCNIEFGVDTSAGTLTGDNSVITVVAKTKDKKFFILMQKVGKFSLRDTLVDYSNNKVEFNYSNISNIGFVDECFRLSRVYHPTRIKIGVAGEEKLNFQEIRRVFQMSGDWITQIIPVVQGAREGSKHERILAQLLPFYETRSVYHCFNASGLEYELEYLGKAKHDDQCDSATVAINNMQDVYNATKRKDLEIDKKNKKSYIKEIDWKTI